MIALVGFLLGAAVVLSALGLIVDRPAPATPLLSGETIAMLTEAGR